MRCQTVKTQECPECEFDTKEENNLEDHAILQCSYYPSNYAQKTNLDNHIKL